MQTLFGKSIQLKKTGCNRLGVPGRPIQPSVNLFVKVTDSCNAHCLFCSNAGRPACSGRFDLDKLVRIIREIQAQGIYLNRVNITGGEPSIVSPLVERMLDKLEKREFQSIHLHLNTNGLLPQSRMLMRHPRWNSISLSLHHYEARRISALYGCPIDEQALDFTGMNTQILNVSCNLIKGYIDCAEEARKMLDFTLALGVPRIGFVALMKVNDFCKAHFVDLETVGIEKIPHVYFTYSMDRGTDCKCSNYLYNKGLRILEIYMRNYANPSYCESSLVYDGQYLRQGFQADNVIY